MRVLFVAAFLASVGVPVLASAAPRILAGSYLVSGQRLCQYGGITLYAGTLQFDPESQTAREELYITTSAGIEHTVTNSIPYSATRHALTLDGFKWKAAFGQVENRTAQSAVLLGLSNSAAPKGDA